MTDQPGGVRHVTVTVTREDGADHSTMDDYLPISRARALVRTVTHAPQGGRHVMVLVPRPGQRPLTVMRSVDDATAVEVAGLMLGELAEFADGGP